MSPQYKERVVLVLIGIIACIGYAPLAEAGFVPQTMRGTVEFSTPVDPSWKPLTSEILLGAGDKIQTGAQSSVDLQGEDGSLVQIGEQTQIAIAELEFSKSQHTRISRLNLLWGKITATVAKSGFKNDAFEVQTNIVIAGVKASKLQVEHARDDMFSTIICREGECYSKRIREQGRLLMSGVFDSGGAIREGLKFEIPAATMFPVSVRVSPANQEISVLSKGELTGMMTMVGETRIIEVENQDKSPLFTINYLNGEKVEVQEQDAVTSMLAAGSDVRIGAKNGIQAIFRFYGDLEEYDFLWAQRECECTGLFVGMAEVASFSRPIPVTKTRSTAQVLSGIVEVATSDGLQWQPLTRERMLQAGDMIRTGEGGTVSFTTEDGSLLYLEEPYTQLNIVQAEFSENPPKRIFRVKIVQGRVSVAITEFSSESAEQNIFALETDLVALNAKGSEARITHRPQEFISEVVIKDGAFSGQRLSSQGGVTISGVFDSGKSLGGEGISFRVPAENMRSFTVTVDSAKQSIRVFSETLLEGMIALVGNMRMLDAQNEKDASPFTINYLNGESKAVEKEEQVTTIIAASGDVGIGMTAKGINAIFKFREDFQATEMFWMRRKCPCGRSALVTLLPRLKPKPIEQPPVIPVVPPEKPPKSVGSPILPE